jgi:hypothetical protein
MKHLLAPALWLTASSAALAQASGAAAGSRFDGDWLVTMSCPSNTEDSAARGYRRQFPAQVKDGILSGEDGTAGGPGWLRIGGPIGGDGSARLDARGRTGNPEYAVDHPPSSSPYAFHIEARFDPAHGTGKRLEARVCTFAFDRK